ncbi:MAG: hypothetical protein AAF214_10855 [Pseudomonadota bacterium]
MTDPDKTPPHCMAVMDQMLDDLAHAPVPDVPDAVMARVMEDAMAMLPPPGGVVAPVAVPWWRDMLQAIGGWTAVGGLVAAAATGFVVGVGGLDTVSGDAIWSLGTGTYYDGSGALDAFGWDFEEG